MELQFNFFSHAIMIQCRHSNDFKTSPEKISGDKVISDQCMRRLKKIDCSKVDPFLFPGTSSLLKKKTKCSAPARSYVPPAKRHKLPVYFKIV